ncbi:class I SAM-dependent rRNA methyltransferase [Dictyobacter arantiisoli]|uniref:Ribosomal RNA large subunit methyltransferase I n=1 Tax=Dictyobacter arantiisoli TaxID=2014874 RepID=A0A5A5TIG6_9CHLR|nr:class I SAM-dependent rRNA methyltransferase [Dictyobacter arantiisoli]GCF10998.1 ribosomal RNA large subunit methyltransferase I [Dictyobacter arantiisoli]
MSVIKYPTASLKPHKEKHLLAGHLWIFSGALQQSPRWVEPGGLLDVKSATGQFVARGYYNPNTDIAVRILTREIDDYIDAGFFRRRIRQALATRRIFDNEYTNTYRMINSEGDRLPGLIVDRYADILVAQIHTAGMEQLFPQIAEVLIEETHARGILLRNDSQSRRREGLDIEPPRVFYGEVPEQIEVIENNVKFLVDVWHGQKTGLFLDQRDKRASLRKYTHHKRVLNCFSYTGGFSVYSAVSKKAPATVTSVDISESAMEAAVQNFILNDIDPADHQFIVGDVFEYLEAARDHNEKFDIVVLDPPAFAKSKGNRAQAIQAYHRLNMLGLQLLNPGGILMTSSCSGVISMDDLKEVVESCAKHLRLTLQLVESQTHGVDHPVHNSMPETAYLKALFYRLN